jgi:hypothetical protein
MVSRERFWTSIKMGFLRRDASGTNEGNIV